MLYVKNEGDKCPRHDPNTPPPKEKPPELPEIKTIQDVVDAQAMMMGKMMLKEVPTSKDFASFSQLSRAFVSNKNELELTKRMDAMEKAIAQQ